MTSKFVGFFQLVEACAQPGCPVCRCLREEGLRHLEALMYEQVNDPGTRGTLRSSWGFCNWHAWMLGEIPGSGLGTAIIYEDLLRRALGRLRRLLLKIERGAWSGAGLLRWVGRRPRIPILEAWRDKADCMICRSLGASEATYLRTIFDFSGDPEFDRAFDRSWGVCLPHLLHLVQIGRDHARLEPVLTKVEDKWRQLQDLLKRFIEKHDYRATEKFTEEEAESWRQAVEMLAGGFGLFGNALHPGRRAMPSAPLAAPSPAESPAAEGDLETLRFEKAKLELRLKQLTDQFNEVSSRAASLHYRLWQVLEDRKVIEMNLSGEQAAGRIWERRLEELQQEIERLQAQLGGGPSGRSE